ncbi:hypothetical protein J4Q44_G00300020 [Coregonus suidteri]|uniref:Uncharacterized protein n=1 Tax=Coregonus suidteri TaxID=861788 RepID=A0AAN8L2Z5_9TELE
MERPEQKRGLFVVRLRGASSSDNGTVMESRCGPAAAHLIEGEGEEIEDVHSILGKVKVRSSIDYTPKRERGPAVRFSTFESREPMPPPMIGQHTVQVLRDSLSYSDDVINQLLASGTVAQNEVH